MRKCFVRYFSFLILKTNRKKHTAQKWMSSSANLAAVCVLRIAYIVEKSVSFFSRLYSSWNCLPLQCDHSVCIRLYSRKKIDDRLVLGMRSAQLEKTHFLSCFCCATVNGGAQCSHHFVGFLVGVSCLTLVCCTSHTYLWSCWTSLNLLFSFSVAKCDDYCFATNICVSKKT